MARSRTAINTGDVSLPPWERANVVPVPYMDSTSPSLSNAEREALTSLWAVHTNEASRSRSRGDSHTRYGSDSSQRRGPSSDECFNSWGVKTPLTAPMPPRPYKTPVYIPPAPKSTPNPPTFAANPPTFTNNAPTFKSNPPTFARAPPTPPDSVMESWTTKSTSDSPPSKAVMKALPNVPTYIEPSRPSRTRKASSLRESHRRATRLQRWKSALKEMFAREPVDETNLVHISAQGHWTDD